ncbi:MAG TPA: MarR family transcriptional regulator [Gemmataceae bacterium]|jgi:DNA-binding MarR family transcriptional regulator
MTLERKVNRAPQTPPAKPEGPELDAWVLLVAAYHRIIRRLEQALDGHGLSLAQFEVLAHLHFDGAITQNELAQRLLVTKGNVCGLLDRMGAAGLVERKADPEDRRANRLVLTPRGTALLTDALPPHLALIRETMGQLSAEELQTLHGLLARLAGPVPECGSR